MKIFPPVLGLFALTFVIGCDSTSSLPESRATVTLPVISWEEESTVNPALSTIGWSWNDYRGQDVKVAIIDSGIDPNHGGLNREVQRFGLKCYQAGDKTKTKRCHETL